MRNMVLARAGVGSRRWGTMLRDGVALMAIPVIGLQFVHAVVAPATFTDALAYYTTSATDPYRFSTLATPMAYLYSPAFLQAIAPLRALPEWGFVLAIVLAEAGALLLLTGRNIGWTLFLFVPIWELSLGNINLLLAVAIVVGFRYPAAWATVLLTKVTPGVGVLWFAARREWGSLAAALGATAVIAAVSFVFAPGQWTAWLGVLRANGTHPVAQAFAAELPARVAIAALVVLWGARTDRRWVVPVAAAVATPGLSLISASIVIGVVPLLTQTPLSWRPRKAAAGHPTAAQTPGTRDDAAHDAAPQAANSIAVQ